MVQESHKGFRGPAGNQIGGAVITPQVIVHLTVTRYSILDY
jgi:hypothetical protein